jgi:hypothetical protein
VLKQERVDCVVVHSKLHVSERSTAPYIVSTSQPPADRTTIATLSQQFGLVLVRHDEEPVIVARQTERWGPKMRAACPRLP